MQNKDRRSHNFGFNDWLSPDSYNNQSTGHNMNEWHPEQSDGSFDQQGDYYMDFGKMGPEQSYPNYQEYEFPPQPNQYYGDMSRYHAHHDSMNARTQQAPRHHIQQVHPRNSNLHSTNVGRPLPTNNMDRGYGRSGSYSPSLPPTNLLVHQPYRPTNRPYEERYQQTPPPPSGPQYAHMSHYDLSAHVRNQGALNWSTGNVQVPGGTTNPPRQINANQQNRNRYPAPQNQLPYSNPNQTSGTANFLGNNAARSLLTQPTNQRNGNTAAPTNRNSDMAGRDIELEQLIYRNAKAILAETANRCLKSVELANALRDRIGKEALQRTKVLYGGLLVLLELYRETFAVHRIPKNDMVELLTYVAPQYASHTIQHPQQLLASQIPGYNISAPNLTSNTSFPNGSLIGTNPSLTGTNDSNANSNGTQINPETTPTLYQTLTKDQTPTKCLFISNVPDDITGNQIWSEFGGEDIVEKVSVDFQGDQRTGVVWFTSVNAAKAALNIPGLVKWKDVLSFIDPSEVTPPADSLSDEGITVVDSQSSHSHTLSSNSSLPSFEDPFGPPPGLSDTTASYLPSSARSQNSFFDVSVTMANERGFPQNSNHSDDHLVVDFSHLTITTEPVGDSTPSSTNDTPRGTFRKAAPPPIVTADLSSAPENPTPRSMQGTSPGHSPTSTPGGTPHLSFTFFDSSAPGGITTLPKETLPKEIHDVMNTLCDVYYVPQKTWEKSTLGDYLFCQAIVDILSGQFNGVFVQMTKLKQQLKRKLGGSIRIGPLKALVIAYPEYFEVDRTVNLVRSLKTELPYMDISVVTSA